MRLIILLFRRVVIACCLFSFVLLCGCEAFVRKFTRKSKKDEERAPQLVLAPEEYKAPQMSKEEVYRQYFLFWKSWHSELVESFNAAPTASFNYKKPLSCIKESISNLEQLSRLLNAEKQKQLDIYIKKMKMLQDDIAADSYGSSLASFRLKAEDLKRNILRDFSYQKIKDSLI